MLNQNSAFRTKGWACFLKPKSMLQALLCNDSATRLKAFNLLVDHPKRSRVISAMELRLIRLFLITNFCEQIPAARMLMFKDIKTVIRERNRNKIMKYVL